MTTHYTMHDPLPPIPRTDCVYVVVYDGPGLHEETLHRTLAGATGRVGGILGTSPGRWYRDDAEAYLWRYREIYQSATRTLRVVEREVGR